MTHGAQREKILAALGENWSVHKSVTETIATVIRMDAMEAAVARLGATPRLSPLDRDS